MSLIDIHFHGTEKIDIREAETSQEILQIAKEMGDRGITGFLLTLYPDAPQKMRKKLSIIKKAMVEQGEGAIILGAYLEGPFLNPRWSGALDKSKFLQPHVDKLREIIDGYEEIVRVITVAPELPNALKLIETCRALGIIVSLGHSDATFNEAQEGFRAGARLITHLFNAMRGIHHREPGLSGFGLMNEEIYVEIIADGRHIHDEVISWIFKVKNPLRIILVSDMVKDSGDAKLIKGGSMSLKDIKNRLLSMHFDDKKIERATYWNVKELLKI